MSSSWVEGDKWLILAEFYQWKERQVLSKHHSFIKVLNKTLTNKSSFFNKTTSIRYNSGLWAHCQTTEILPSLQQTHLLLGILPLSQLLFRQRYHICLCRPEIAPIPCCHLLCHSVSVHHHYNPDTVETGTSGLSGCSPLFISFDFTAVPSWWLEGHRNTMLVWNTQP